MKTVLSNSRFLLEKCVGCKTCVHVCQTKAYTPSMSRPLDKNYLKILEGVENALLSIREWKDIAKVVQLKSGEKTLLEETLIAVRLGAHVIMIDTGRRKDIERVNFLLNKKGMRERVKIAFGGEIQIQDLKVLRKMPVDIVDIGKAILDAPLLDMKMDVLRRI